MYKSDEIDLFPKEIEKIYSCLENEIMNDIIRRIAKAGELTRTADWELSRLYNMGANKIDIKKHIQEELNLSEAEINLLYSNTLKEGYLRDESLYQAVGQEFIPFEENVELQQLIEATKEQTAKQLKNITRTIGFSVKQPNGRKKFKTVDNYFKDTMDNAVMHVLNGTFDYNSIIKRTTDEMSKSGVRSINYDSGISTRIDVAARRAILTGVNQVTGKISANNMQKLNTEFVETSWHSTARPTHQVWQGRVFYWDRTNPNAEKEEDGVLYKSFIRETGYGEVDGLCGANCRHTFYPFIPGISVRTYTDEQLEELNKQENEKKEYNGKEYNKYEATQYQRRLETLMRKYRQDINLLKQSGLKDDSDEVIAAKCKYQTMSQKYSDFCKKMGLCEHRDKVNADGLKDIGHGIKKNEANELKNGAIIGEKSGTKSVEKSSNSDIIKNITINDFEDAALGKEIQQEILNVINDNCKDKGMFFNEVSIEKIPDEDGKKVLLQTEPYFGGQRVLTRLKINENVFMGRSLNEINKQINESPNIVANNLQEAVWHENGHAKTYFNKTIDEVEEINNELDNIHFDNLSPTASQNGSELIAEVEVLLKRGEEVPREAIDIYKRYIGG